MLYSHTIKLVRFYDGADGFKTGYTKEAGYCLTATAKKNGMRIIAVVMGEEDSKTRNSEVTSMLDYAFAQYKLDTILSKNTVIEKRQVDKGKQKHISIVPKEDITVLHKKSEKPKKVDYSLQLEEIKAPIQKGDKMGTIIVKKEGKKIKTIQATAKQSVEKANILELYIRNIIDIISGEIHVKS